MTPVEMLRGLAPSLVVDLAELAADDPRDVAVTVQLMPFGDRTALAAYGAIRYDRHRHVRVLPLFDELTSAALAVVCGWARDTGFYLD